MAKSKNHTNHNQNRKHHRNPTRKPSAKTQYKMKGMDPKFLRNLKFAKKHNLSHAQQALLTLANSRVLSSSTDQRTFKFLQGSRPGELCASPPPVVCQSCWEKITIVASIQTEVQSPPSVLDPKNDPWPEVDLEELNNLSAFYAENSDSDPEHGQSSSSSQAKIQRKEEEADVPYLMCQLCNSSLRRVASLRRHYITQHHYDPGLADNPEPSGVEGQPPLNCQECQEEFLSQHGLIKHALNAHTGEFQTTFKCAKCEKTYRYERDLKIHQERLCSRVVGQSQDCPHCSKSCNVSNLQAHITFTHKCHFCADIFPSRREKCTHMRVSHAQDLKHTCQECQQSFESELHLKRHRKAKHDVHVVNCPKPNCPDTFVKGSVKLKKHLKHYHSVENENLRLSFKFVCLHCGKRVRTDSHLRSHIRNTHRQFDMVKCPFCEHKVPKKRQNDLYRHHIKPCHPEQTVVIAEYEARIEKWRSDFDLRARVQCFLCPYSASKVSNLPRHYEEMHEYDKSLAEANEVHPDHPDGALCTECGEHFNNRHSQIRHLLKVHSKSTGEQCLYCTNRYFKLDEHIDTMHSEDKAQLTQFCRRCQPEQRFTSFDDLLRHTRSYHRKKHETLPPSSKDRSKRKLSKNRLCENCGKTLPAPFMARHRTECLVVDESRSKRYVPVHLSGICPFCDLKFSDLLGHIRHGHAKDPQDTTLRTTCGLCQDKFGSVRELVTHRQLHPTFKRHACAKCRAEFESVNEVRIHRKETCSKRKTRSEPAAAGLALLQQMAEAADGLGEMQASAKSKHIEYEGRGTVSCHLCTKAFTLKTLLRRHLISHHGYDPSRVDLDPSEEQRPLPGCEICVEAFPNIHARIKHQLDFHSVVSGLICPYCSKKFDDLDGHAHKYHLLEVQSPIQTCITCKLNFSNYEDLKVHRQLHEGGNKRVFHLPAAPNAPPNETIALHSRVGANPEIRNRGGVKCQLCNAFKLRKDHLKLHYINHHGYKPKTTDPPHPVDDASNLSIGDVFSCPSCHEFFPNNNLMIKHILKNHTQYLGQICPYCGGHFPERFIDLQAHVTVKHMDQLTSYNVVNECKVCKEKLTGYAQLRDHVQGHGDNYRDPYGNPEAYREYGRKRRRVNGKLVPIVEEFTNLVPDALDDNAHDVSFPQELLEEIIQNCPSPNPTEVQNKLDSLVDRNPETLLSEPGTEEPNRDELFDL
eukprot:snap_masked-scaffold243_size241480-processed-gene-1.11 protein:Tk02958 transcript:snap_masked-scaffold243_size241480-processed-gene-1.11-mRNA-1 annotation:"unnamed protein product"